MLSKETKLMLEEKTVEQLCQIIENEQDYERDVVDYACKLIGKEIDKNPSLVEKVQQQSLQPISYIDRMKCEYGIDCEDNSELNTMIMFKILNKLHNIESSQRLVKICATIYIIATILSVIGAIIFYSLLGNLRAF